MRQYETDRENGSHNKISFWAKFKPARKRRIKRIDENDNTHTTRSSLKNSSNVSHRVNSLPFRKIRQNGQIESLCNGHTVCDNIAVEGDTTSEDEVVVQIVDDLMAVPEGLENINELNTPSTSYESEMTHI